MHKLKAQLLQLRKEQHAATQKEEEQQARLRAAAAEDEEDAAWWGDLSSQPAASRAGDFSREAVLSQSQQLAWRCQELRDLEEKIAAQQRQQSSSKRQKAVTAERELFG